MQNAFQFSVESACKICSYSILIIRGVILKVAKMIKTQNATTDFFLNLTHPNAHDFLKTTFPNFTHPTANGLCFFFKINPLTKCMIQSHAVLSKLKKARISAQDRARTVGLVEGGMPYNQVSVFDNTNIHKNIK